MDHLEDSSDRSRFELALFAITFFATLIGIAGAVLAVPSVAIIGGVVAFLSVFVFFVRSLL